MPSRLPMTVIIAAILRHAYKTIRMVTKTVFLVVLWLFMVPTLTFFTLSFTYDAEGSIRKLSDPLTLAMFNGLGLVTTAFMVVSFIGLLLLRDYMSSHGLLRIKRKRRPRELRGQQAPIGEPQHFEALPNADATDTRELANLGDASVVPTNNQRYGDDIQSEVTAAPSTINTERSSWLQGVTPREYRAYLRRRELCKLRRSQKETTIDPQEVPDDCIPDDAGPSQHPSRFPAQVASPIASSGEGPEIDDSHRPISLRQESGSGGAGSSESFSCKICNSPVCVNKAHVVAASRTPITEAVGLENYQPDITSSPSNGPTSMSAHAGISPLPVPIVNDGPDRLGIPPAAMGNPEALLEDNNNDAWNILGVDAEGNAMTFSEFIGAQGPMGSTLQNALMVVLCNLLFVYGFILIPRATGRVLIQNAVPGVRLIWVRLMTSINPSEPDLIYRFLIYCGGRMSAIGVATLGYIRSAPIWLSHYLPARLTSNLAIFNTSAQAILRQFDYLKNPAIDFVLQVAFGQFIMVYMGYAYKMVILNFTDWEIQGFQETMLQMFTLLHGLFKLSVVLFSELLIFPTICGWIIDWNLSTVIVGDRWTFFIQYPLVNHLMRWAVGIASLIFISLAVRQFRKIFRPGLLYFIRNSDDPENLPFKEAVERPLSEHFRRMWVSVILYTLTLSLLFGGFSAVCWLLAPGIVPFNFDFSNVLHEIPYDIFSQMFSHFIIGILRVGGPDVLIRAYLRLICRMLRLSSYFYGGRYKSEEKATSGRWVYVPDFDRLYKSERVERMFRRPVVPTDLAEIPVFEGPPSSALSPEAPAPVVHRGLRRHRHERARNARNEFKKNGFTVVYRPGLFSLRVTLFLFGLWLLYQVLALVFVVAPVIVGRFAYRLILPVGRKVIDIHAFQVGLLLLSFTAKVLQVSIKCFAENGSWSFLRQLFKVPLFMLKAFALLFMVIFVWPSLFGLYWGSLISPFLASLDETPIMPPFVCWFIGVSSGNLFWMIRDSVFSRERNQIIDRLKTLDGWWNMNFTEVFIKLLLPYTVRLCILIFGPPVAILLFAPLLGLSFSQLLLLQRWSNLISLAVPGVIFLVWAGLLLRSRLLRNIRDENYLIGERLNNLERPAHHGDHTSLSGVLAQRST